MKPKITIHVEEFVRDLRSGLTEGELMEKYELGIRSLRKVYDKLIQAGFVRADEVYRRPAWSDESILEEPRRRAPRHVLAFRLPIYEEGRPEVRATISDISEDGFAIGGMRGEVREIRTFVVSPKEFCGVPPFTVDAVCHWTSRDPERGIESAGYQIARIAERDLERLRAFIRFITIGD